MNKLTARVQQVNSLLCVGLDPIGGDAQVESRLAEVIEQTAEYAAAFKPNLAFFLSRAGGVELLQRTVHRIPSEVLVILDGKFGDIANTADHYARFAYDVIGADSVTVNPYMGDDSIVLFAREGKMVFVLAKTSNKPAHSLQDVTLTRGGDLADHAARVAQELNEQHHNIGLVVGATNSDAMARMRSITPQQWFLVPGIGAQGGDLEATLRAGLRPDGQGLLINTSRAIWQASDAEAAAKELNEQINQLRPIGV